MVASPLLVTTFMSGHAAVTHAGSHSPEMTATWMEFPAAAAAAIAASRRRAGRSDQRPSAESDDDGENQRSGVTPPAPGRRLVTRDCLDKVVAYLRVIASYWTSWSCRRVRRRDGDGHCRRLSRVGTDDVDLQWLREKTRAGNGSSVAVVWDVRGCGHFVRRAADIAAVAAALKSRPRKTLSWTTRRAAFLANNRPAPSESPPMDFEILTPYLPND
jgi:hypothetical protein